MLSIWCPHCDGDVEIKDPFSHLYQPLECPSCHNMYELHYESIWNPGMEDSASFFCAVKVGEEPLW